MDEFTGFTSHNNLFVGDQRQSWVLVPWSAHDWYLYADVVSLICGPFHWEVDFFDKTVRVFKDER